MSNVNINTPLQLIRFKDNRFEIPEETKEFLRNFKNPLGIITIVGKYRTGKSLFLNKVLLRNSTFKVSPTINSCTKGLWMCRQTIKSQNNEEADVLVIDTEGFGATEETDAYNNKILLFAMLLSSYFIYNSVGSIDENSLNNLNIIANLAKEIQKTNNKDQKIDEEFPAFLWLVRDFTLNLVDKNGFPIQAREYLEQALEIQKGTSDAIENKNKIRRMIKHFFKDRDCFTMIRPVDTEEKLQNLLALNDTEFRLQFLEQITNLRNKILKKIKSKKIKGKPLDGEMLLQLASTYVDAINSGSLPNFQMSYKHLMKYQLNKATHQFISQCKHKLHEYSSKMHSKQKIIQIQEQFTKDLQVRFKEGTIDNEDHKVLMTRMRKDIKDMMHTFEKENTAKTINNCHDIWAQLYDQYKNFDDFAEIQSYFADISQQFEENIEQSGNPISKQYYQNHILSHKGQAVNKYIQRYHEETQIDMKEKSTKISDLQQQLISQKNEKQTLDNKLFELNREHLKLNGRFSEFEKIKQMEISYLKQKEAQNNEEILQLVHKNQEYARELEICRNTIMEQQIKGEELNRNYRQSCEEKRLVEKELEILKSNLQSRNEEIAQLKTNLSETTMRLENSLEKEVFILTKNQTELECKSQQYGELKRRNQSQQQQIGQLTKSLLKSQLELETTKCIAHREKGLYENMFESFKESLKSQSISRQGLIQTNKNLSSALKTMEKRAEQAEEKEKQLKQFKKCVKNASCLQCQHCTKFFVPSIFIPHLNVCLIGPQALKSTRLDKNLSDKPKLEIKVKQTLVKESDGKPFTEYLIEVKKGTDTWIINRKYKAFCDLNSALKSALPGVELSDASSTVNPHEVNKKSLVIEQRRKNLQKYLNDLASNPLVYNTLIWKQFIEEPQQNYAASLSSSPLKQNTKKAGNQQQTPEEFFKIWNERKMRGKQSSMTKKYKPV